MVSCHYFTAPAKKKHTPKQIFEIVLDAPLHKHSSEASAPSSLPPSLHAGTCTERNPIAAILTNSFLDFASSNGTDLRRAGVGPDQRYCLDASIWKNAADKGGEVPRVKLEATHKGALNKVELETLKKWAAGHDKDRGVIWPSEGKESWARESSDIGAKDPRS